jgi:hypothetical protein
VRPAPSPSEGATRVPPRRYLLEEMALHEVLRPGSGERMPDKQTRREYVELHDLVVGRDFPDILAALLGEDPDDEDGA